MTPQKAFCPECDEYLYPGQLYCACGSRIVRAVEKLPGNADSPCPICRATYIHVAACPKDAADQWVKEHPK